jgi:LAO/AO transport system kinase
VLIDADKLLAAGVCSGDRRALAKAITLLESTLPDHQARSQALLNTLLPRAGQSLRLGISGAPGAGKSTFIEAFGLRLVAAGHKVAVLAIDPSSCVTGGSILADKTRMEQLAASNAAYIRPTPSSGALGGVAGRTREAMLLCEAAGFDVVLVETVGVGQSEIAVAGMIDLLVLLQLPNTGDDLQAMKKGVMELADVIVVNKCDLDPTAASRAELQLAAAVRALSATGNPAHNHTAPVLRASAATGEGMEAFWKVVSELHETCRVDGRLATRRRDQALNWMWDLVNTNLTSRFRDHPAVRAALPQTAAAVAESRLAPASAAQSLLDLFGS